MDINKSFLTVTEQINHLKAKGIKITSEKSVKEILEKNSYYDIINGYNKPFLFMAKPKKYILNLNFLEIYALYEFDNKIRNIIFPYLLEIESILKTEIIYSFSNSRDSKGELVHINDDYLKINSYDISNIKKSLNVIVELEVSIAKNLEKHNCLLHYLTNYSYIPLWVLGTIMTFGNISRFYESMKLNDRQAVSKKYKLPENQLTTILKVLTTARNCCAHKNRLFCLKHSYSLPIFDLTKHPKQHHFTSKKLGNRNLFSVIISMSLLLPQKRMKSLINAIENELNILEKKLIVITIDRIMNIMGFPNDWKSVK